MLLQSNVEYQLTDSQQAIIVKGGPINLFVKGQLVDFVLDGSYEEGFYNLPSLTGLIIKYTGAAQVELVGV